MKDIDEINKIMKRLRGRYGNRHDNIEPKKRDWYKIGKYLLGKNKIRGLHKESQVSARRTYHYYNYNKGNWEGPTAKQLGKMDHYKFEEEFAARIVRY